MWEGVFFSVQSLALVNREICLRLIERGHEVSLVSLPDRDEESVPPVNGSPAFLERLRKPISRGIDMHLRHSWPPDFKSPPAGHWVIMQPWEYGSLPRDWINPIVREVDEVWAYTRYVRDCYVESGVPAERVHVVPLGVDTQRFHPQAVPLALATKKPFKFLFVGGTIVRKGIDVLLKAYRREFSANDPVCLVIKDMGGGSFYRGQTAQAAIAEHQADLLAPEIEYIDRNLTADELVGLYAACQSLVHPYRGEGFGLPIAEAMACELPVIVTGAGAAMDYCNQDNAFLIPARKTYLPAKRIGSLQTVSRPWLLEPDEEALQAHLRNVFEHPEEAKAKGRAAGAHIRQHFGWENVLNAVEHRLSELQRQPVRRTRLKNSVMPVIRPASRGEPAPTGQRVSLCMIVKNEAANLPACLHSAADLVDELIVVDTGSTDITKELAKECGARVYDFKWVDDFAAARNESLRYATGDWIFWLDGDDRLDEENREKLRKLFASLRDENVAYAMKCRCLPERQTGTATLVDHIRLFRNSRDIRWRYRVHEQILPAVRGAGGSVRTTDIVIEHTGYIDGALRRKKQQRDMRLLELDRAEHPDDPFILFNLGWSYEELRRPLEALPLLRRSLKLSHPADSIVRKLYTLIMECHRQLGQRNEALAACQEGRGYYPDDAQLLFQEGILRRDLGDLPVPKRAGCGCSRRLRVRTWPASWRDCAVTRLDIIWPWCTRSRAEAPRRRRNGRRLWTRSPGSFPLGWGSATFIYRRAAWWMSMTWWSV